MSALGRVSRRCDRVVVGELDQIFPLGVADTRSFEAASQVVGDLLGLRQQTVEWGRGPRILFVGCPGAFERVQQTEVWLQRWRRVMGPGAATRTARELGEVGDG